MARAVQKQTTKQQLGAFGELRVTKDCGCPKCKRRKTLVRLPTNFKCADIVCDFCGYLAQVKTTRVNDIATPPATVLGAAWRPQSERMESGIYFPLFLVLVDKQSMSHSIFYLSADLQVPEMFVPRQPLSTRARRAGWQGFIYDLGIVAGGLVRLY